MAFDINSINSTVVKLFKQGAMLPAVMAATAVGITSSNLLTDIVFFLRYPDRGGKALAKIETSLINEWLAIQKEIEELFKHVPSTPTSSSDRPWMDIAWAEQKRWSTIADGEKGTDVDEQYFMAAPYFGDITHADGVGATPGNNPDWCSAFVNWCLHRAGYSHTGHGGNGSFGKRSKWHFKALKEPRVGCVMLVGKGSRSSHVAFLSRFEKLPKGNMKLPYELVWGSQRLYLLGGNQKDNKKMRVCEKRFYPEYKIFPHKGIDGKVTSPYLWPLRTTASCTITSVPSAHQHFCGHNPASV